MKKVIDADNMKLIEYFDVSETEAKLNYYSSLGKWDDVGVDINGDIILWEE